MTRLLLLAGAAVLSVAASAAQAQPRPDPANLFAKADANHDGLVTRAEFQAAVVARFHRFDRNGDGVLSQDDVPASLRAMHPELPRLNQWRARFDSDHDGTVSLAEFSAIDPPAPGTLQLPMTIGRVSVDPSRAGGSTASPA